MKSCKHKPIMVINGDIFSCILCAESMMPKEVTSLYVEEVGIDNRVEIFSTPKGMNWFWKKFYKKGVKP